MITRIMMILIIITIIIIISKSYTCNSRGTTTNSETLRQYLSNIPEKHEIKKLQKTAILATAHILREVLM